MAASVHLPATLQPRLWSQPIRTRSLAFTTFQNVTLAPAWVADSGGRGTWTLLYSCVFTLLLCIWTSIHMNVPPHEETQFQRWIHKLKWVCSALIAPEVVVFTAFQQWWVARNFRQKLNNILYDKGRMKRKPPFLRRLRQLFRRPSRKGKEKASLDDGDLLEPFSMAYAHYVLMGGLALDVEDFHNTEDRVTLTIHGVLLFAELGHFLEVTEEDISDKSKADLLAKGLICLQVFWMVAQTVVRHIEGLPLTLLEIHTIVHVFCALTMYLLWLSKPLNVQEPIIVRAGRYDNTNPGVFNGTVAWMLMTQAEGIDQQRWRSLWTSKASEGPINELQRCRWYGDVYCHSIAGLDQCPRKTWQDDFPDPSEVPKQATKDNRQCKALEAPPEILDGDKYGILRGGESNESKPLIIHWSHAELFDDTCDLQGMELPSRRELVPKGCALYLDQALSTGIGNRTSRTAVKIQEGPLSLAPLILTIKDINRWNFASRVFRNARYETRTTESEIRGPVALRQPPTFDRYVGICLCFRAKNLSNSLNIGAGQTGISAILALVAASYGGVHLSAIVIGFPTEAEGMLWEIACFTLIGSAGMTAVGAILLGLYFIFFQYWGEGEQGISWSWKWTPLFIFGIIYTAARLYLVVESFISIRRVPIGVYHTPSYSSASWAAYIPHF